MFIQEGVRKMRHMLEIPYVGMDEKGRHLHQCEYCPDKMLCQDTFYVRTHYKEIGDVVLCRGCANIPEMQQLFPALARLLEIGSNVTDKHGVYKYGLQLEAAKGV